MSTGKKLMMHFPSALELELLSERELMNKRIEVLQVMNEKAGIQEDARDDQELYEAIKTEQLRRKNLPVANIMPPTSATA